MRLFGKSKAVVFSLVMVLLLSGLVGAKPIVFKASHTGAERATAGKALDFMAKLINERSDGRIKMEVFHRGILSGGSGTTLLDQVRSGAVEMQVGAQAVYTTFEPKWMLVSLPFLFDSAGESQMFYDSSEIIEELLAGDEKYGLTSVALWGREMRQIANSKRPIRTPEDAKGLRLRVPEIALWQTYFRAIEVNATPMAFGEVYTALQLHTVDGQENALDNMYENSFHEVQKYLTLIDYTTDTLVVSFNPSFWKSLSKEDQALIRQAAKDAGKYKFSIDSRDNRAALVKMMEAGLVVTPLSEEEREAFRIKAKGCWQEFEKVIGEDLIRRALLELGKDPNWFKN